MATFKKITMAQMLSMGHERKNQFIAPDHENCFGFVPGAMAQKISDLFCAIVPGAKFKVFLDFPHFFVARKKETQL